MFLKSQKGLFTIQERRSASRRGFPKVDEYDVLEPGEEELIAELAERIQYLYEELQRLGYLS